MLVSITLNATATVVLEETLWTSITHQLTLSQRQTHGSMPTSRGWPVPSALCSLLVCLAPGRVC